MVVSRKRFDPNTGLELEPKELPVTIPYLQRIRGKILVKQTRIANELADVDEMIADLEAQEVDIPAKEV